MTPILPEKMNKSFSKAQEMLKLAEDIKIYSHNDCDGISSGAILSSLLDRLDKEHEIEFISLDKLNDLKTNNELTIFSDLGSGQSIDKISTSSSRILVLDHHPPLRSLNYNSKLSGKFLEINPLFYGIDGSYEISGGGMCYLLAKKFGFYDLSWIGVLSAVGDMQNTRNGKLEGINKSILQDATNHGLVDSAADLSIYGRQTRPLIIALSYFSDVTLPITNNKTEVILLLKKLGIDRRCDNRLRTLSDLTSDEKTRLFSELVKLLSREVPEKYIKYVPKLVTGDYYEFLNEEEKTPLRDASEFSTAVNACSRNKNPEVALDILKGDRVLAMDELERLTRKHRQYLAEKIRMIEDNELIVPLNNLQYFHGHGIKSEVVGTITGMVLSHGDWRKPIIGFSHVDNGEDLLKVSLRCSRLLAYDGIHFGHIMRKIASKVGGSGGGHAVACGAYIPSKNQDEFLKIFNSTLKGIIN